VRAPRPRLLLAVVAVLVVVVAGVALVWRDQVSDVYGYLFPAGIVDGATSRTSPAAGVSDAGPPLPELGTASGATGEDPPALALRALVDLDGPSALVDPPGPGPVLVATLDGRVHAADLDDGTSEVVLDLSGQVSTGGERGLLGLALSPDSERLYLNHTNLDGDTEVVSLPFRDGRPEGGADDVVRHLRIGQPYRNHNGGHLVFGPDGALWIGTGDGGSANDPAGVAQDPDLVLGKMLRVVPDPTGGVLAPATNPEWGDRPEVWGIGLRNPWRYSFDRETNRLWIADVGQDAVEEVNVVDPAADRVNLGWARLEGSRPFAGEPGPDLTDPVVEYGHDDGCSVTGGYVYRGSSIPELSGWYLFGDFCGGWIRAVPADEPETEPRQLAGDLGPVVAFAELEDGELVLLGTTGVSAIVQE
jgi:glucose/arabinose dehydrogenase